MKKRNYLKFNSILLFLVLMLGMGSTVFSQTVKTVGATGADYPNLRLAFEAINNRVLTGAIELQVTSTITDNNVAKLYGPGKVGEVILVSGGSGYLQNDIITFSAPETPGGVTATARLESVISGSIISIEITNPGSGYINPPTVTVTSVNGTGANITAKIGGDYTSVSVYPTVSNVVLQGAVQSDAIIKLMSADQVTIDGRVNKTGSDISMTVQNTWGANFDLNSTPSPTIFLTNKSQFIDIKYTKILNRFWDVIKIQAADFVQENNNIRIENNYISIVAGTTDRTSTRFFGVNIVGVPNSNITIKNNEFVDLLSRGSASIVLEKGPSTVAIEGNHFYQPTAVTGLTSFNRAIIRILSGSNVVIKNNYMGGTQKFAGGTPWTHSGIGNYYGIWANFGNTSSLSIQGNIIANFNITATGTTPQISSSIFAGIRLGEPLPATTSQITNLKIGDEIPNIIGSSTNNASILFNGNLFGIFTASTSPAIIENNTISGLQGGVSLYGIRTTTDGSTIKGNTVANLKLNSTATSDAFAGIYSWAFPSGALISNNYIYGLNNESAFNTSGINVLAGTVSNNIINLAASNTSSVVGIIKPNIGTLNLYYNTVHIEGSVSAGSKNSYALFDNQAVTVARNYRNNLFINNASNTADGTGKHYAISLTSSPETIDYNNYYASGTGGVLGIFNNEDKTSIESWKTATTKDGFSSVVNPNFTGGVGNNSANFLPTNASLLATPISGFTTDFSGNTRDASPAMGAIEFDVAPQAPSEPTNQDWYVDADGDGYVGEVISQSERPTGGYLLGELAAANKQTGDCNDADAAINPTTVWYLDADSDGYHTGTGVTACVSPGANYINSTSGTDCDDADATKYASFSFFVDADGDGFGTGTAVSVCAVDANTAPAGYSLNSTDCDDTDGTKNASFSFYVDADGDGYGIGTAVSVCAVDANTAPAGYSVNSTDCDDADATKNASFSFYVDADGDGFGKGTAVSVCAANANTAPAGYSVNSTDCDDTDGTKNASFSFYVDADGDGYGTGTAVSVCAVDANTAPVGYSVNSTDCDDADATKNASFSFYVDADGDGFGKGTAVSVCAANANTAPAGYSVNSTDCDDTDGTKNASFSFYVDADGDGYGTGTAVSVCAVDANTAPVGYSVNSTDCDDTDATKNASFSFYVDADGDGFGAGNTVTVCAVDANTAPAGYSVNSTDCDDTDATKNASFSFYVDADGDGFGTGTAVSVCAVDANTAPAGYSVNSTDCDDTDATKNASFSFYVDADGDGFGKGNAVSVCAVDANTPPAGYSVNSTDCDDTNPNKRSTFGFYLDSDKDGFGSGKLVNICAFDANTPPVGYSTNNTDCAPKDASKWRSTLLYIDADNDGYTSGSKTICYGATIPKGYREVANGMDCNDKNANVNPGKTEICGNKIDDDCDGLIDEGCVVACSFSSLSQESWANKLNATKLASLFSSKFPTGLTVGGTGNTRFSIKLTTAASITAFLPNAGTAAVLSKSFTNPTKTSVKNVFAGHLVALTLNIAANPGFGDAVIKRGPFVGKTVSWLLAEANKVISSSAPARSRTSSSKISSSSSPNQPSIAQFADACKDVNLSFQSSSTGYVLCSNPIITTKAPGANNILVEASANLSSPSTSEIRIEAYPNPSTNFFVIKNNSSFPVEIRMINNTGQVMESKLILQAGERKQVGYGYRPGIYLVEAIGEGGRTIQKLIKQ